MRHRKKNKEKEQHFLNHFYIFEISVCEAYLLLFPSNIAKVANRAYQ